MQMEDKFAEKKKPEVKLKKRAEVRIHKRKLAAPKKNMDSYFKKKEMDFLGGKKKALGAGNKKDILQSCETAEAGLRRKKNRVKESSPKSNKPPLSGIPLSSPTHKKSEPADAAVQDNKNQFLKQQWIRKRRMKAAASSNIRIKGQASARVLKGVKMGGLAVLSQLDGGEDINEALHIMGTAKRPVDTAVEKAKYTHEKKKLKVRQPDTKMQAKQIKKDWQEQKKGLRKKQQKKAIKQRKRQYIISKLTGGMEQDSLGHVIKDMVKMKASVLLATAGKFLLGLLAPLMGTVLVAAVPVLLIVVLFYASPLAAFMPNPSEDTPSIQEVLSGYYQEFNAELTNHVGENGTVSYLHMENGNYVSNYMDTMMVYMVQYGTGDLGVVMDEQHQKYLKEVFDEMNSFEDTTVTTTIKAGESLGNVVTSAYCSCSICCGIWSGGPTASGAMPKAEHTIAVDAGNPFLPMGTKVIMNGTEYVVEDTGSFARYGVQFDIYFDNHAAASAWGHKTLEAYLADGDENEVTVTKKGSYVKNLNFEDYIALGKLTKDQEELLCEMMSEDFRAEMPGFGVGSDVAALALTKVGYPYSQDLTLRMTTHYDCSSLVFRCYRDFGIILPGTAAEQGQYIAEHGMEVTEDMLQPGDLIFYSYEVNNRFRNISHVAIYIGNGRMVHASGTTRGVVNDPFRASNVNLYGRPSIGQ